MVTTARGESVLFETDTHHYYGQYDQAGSEHGQGQVAEQSGVGLDAGWLGDRIAINRLCRGQVVQFAVHGRPTFLGRRQVVTLARVRVAATATFMRTRSTTRNALSVLPVEVQREHAGRTAKRAGSAASSARRVTRLAQLCGWVIVLRTRALWAQAVLEHEVRRAGRTLQRAFACKRWRRYRSLFILYFYYKYYIYCVYLSRLPYFQMIQTQYYQHFEVIRKL